MTYLSWAALYEGPTDEAYFSIIIPSLIEEIVRVRGIRNVTVPQSPSLVLGKSDRSIAAVADEICSEKDAFHILFVHADTGGRALEEQLENRSAAYLNSAFYLCDFPIERGVIIAPRHETEAWMLADTQAVGDALGYRGNLEVLGLPMNAQEAENLTDPKAALQKVVTKVRGRRGVRNAEQIIPAIAQRQKLERLRKSASFRSFEDKLVAALRSLGCVAL